jgi:hypothetical protein
LLAVHTNDFDARDFFELLLGYDQVAVGSAQGGTCVFHRLVSPEYTERMCTGQ